MTEWTAWVLAFLYDRREVLHALTAGICLCGGSATFLIWLRTLREQLWLLFFSCAYILWTIQYCFRLGGEILAAIPQAELAARILSTVNNICLLLSAALLLGAWLRSRLGLRFPAIVMLGVTFCVLVAWASYEGRDAAWGRLPDLVFSVITLYFLGWALADAIPLGRYHRTVRTQTFVTSAFYIGFQVLTSLAPQLAPHFGELETAFLVKKDTIEKLASHSTESGGDPSTESGGDPSTDLSTENDASTETDPFVASIDIAAFTAMVPLKLSFFLLAFYIVTRALERLHPRALYAGSSQEKVQRKFSDTSVNALLKGYARMFGADVCEICLRLPGLENPKVLWRSHPRAKKYRNDRLPSSAESNVGRVLVTGVSKWGQVRELGEAYLKRHGDQESILTTPIYHGGAVIGAFNLEWRNNIHITETMALQVEQIASQLALYLEKERELAAISELGRRFARFEAEEALPRELRELVSRCLAITYDLLAPTYLSLHLRMGFSPVSLTAPDLAGESPTEICSAIDLQPLAAGLSVSGETVEQRNKRSWLGKLGELKLFVPRRSLDVEEKNRPILGTSKYHRELIAAVLADAILDGCRRIYARILAELIQALGDPGIDSTGRWLAAIEASLKKAGLCWVAAEAPEGAPLRGPAEVAEWRRLPKVGNVWNGTYVYPCRALLGASSVIRLRLPGLESGWLWIGVPREDFGAELEDPPSPWLSFLTRAAENAGSALARIQARTEIDQLSRQVVVGQALVAQSTVIHEIKNHANGFMSGLRTLVSALEDGKFQMPSEYRELIEDQYEEAKQLREMTRPLARIRAFDEQRPANVFEAATAVEGLYRTRLHAQEAALVVELPSDLPQVNIPFHVLTMALANLVSNSLDAFQSPGVIRLRGTANEHHVFLTVQDNGPGIPGNINVFAAGTTKPAGSGLGLWLTETSLRNEGGGIELTSRTPGNTTFEMQLPILHAKGDRNGSSA